VTKQARRTTELWSSPPHIKVFEALSVVGGGRIETIGRHEKLISSSTGNKHYRVTYSPSVRYMECNDNGSHFVGYLGYPAIAVLMYLGRIELHSRLVDDLKDAPWKVLNVAHKNDYDATTDVLFRKYSSIERAEFHGFASHVCEVVSRMRIRRRPWMMIAPPTGF
jgi:hypothetical protein